MANMAEIERPPSFASWADQLPPSQKSLYAGIMREAHRRGLPFAIGGGIANIAYTGAWRDTKDLDLFILERDRDAMTHILTDLGLRDFYDQRPYDRSWIYRGYIDDQIVDLIWAMANHRARVDEVWVEAGPQMEIEGEEFHIIPPEETLWTKLYVLQRERCDWPDAINLIGAIGTQLDWERLLARLGPDTALLAGLLSVFAWVCPGRASALPAWIWERVGARVPVPGESLAHLLDSRPWLVAPC
jgi:Nucleotidyl transferase of unknown function (DUF2204)